MNAIETIYVDFGCVPCGVKAVRTVKIENKTNKPQLVVIKRKIKKLEIKNDKLQIFPGQTVAQPKKEARFTLSFVSHAPDRIDNYSYEVFQFGKIVAELNVHVQSFGPNLKPKIFDLKFFCLHNTTQISKHVEIRNTTNCETKYYFDIDEDEQEFEVSEPCGTIASGHKLGLKLLFHPTEPGVFYKKFFCVVQYHQPLVFNILAVYQPKLSLDPKCVKFKFPPPVVSASSNYEGYVVRGKCEQIPDEEKPQFRPTFPVGFKQSTEDVRNGEKEEAGESRFWPGVDATEVFLTKKFVQIRNSPQIQDATVLVNSSRIQLYYYEWDRDPNNHFQIEPCKGLVQPKSKTFFTIHFAPSALDSLFHTELDIRIFPFRNDVEPDPSNVVYLPLTISVRIIGNSFSDCSCGWIPQCRISPKVLHLGSCVPGENIYGTFTIERLGHLPFVFSVDASKESNLVVYPPVGYLSKTFQLFVVKFNGESKEPGEYSEDVKIQFNNSDWNFEKIKIISCVEKPSLVLGNENSLSFPPLSPGSKMKTVIPMYNPTNLHLSYEFKTPEDVTWAEIINPTGLIEPKAFGDTEVIFKPDSPCEYLDYIPCCVSSISKMDYVETIHLQLIGSCQFGYLVATPSNYSFGESIYKKKKSVTVHLFNFSLVSLYFRLSPGGAVGDPDRDVVISPNKGCVPAKGSFEVAVTITPHEIDICNYYINCQNVESDSEEAKPQETAKKIFSFTFEGVFPGIQIIDVDIPNMGPLFSPRCLWKMMNINKINKAMQSLKSIQVIPVHIPEVRRDSSPMILNFLLEANRHETVCFEVFLNVICPCGEASKRNVSQDHLCKHKEAVTLKPAKQQLAPRERRVSSIVFDIAHLPARCSVELKMILPYKRTLLCQIPLVILPEAPPSTLSFYLNSTFHLKPVFIGDTHPSVQLFWLYNNTQEPVSYILDNLALRQATSVQGIFDCVNPFGVISPLSKAPLAFVFAPIEITTYKAEVQVQVNGDYRKLIKLKGEGVLTPLITTEVKEVETFSTLPSLATENTFLICEKNVIEIPFFRTFSQVKRVFFLKNKSQTDDWTFHWHKISAENLFSASVEPATGVVEPGEDALMCLTVESFCYPSYLNFSLPCDVINYAQLKAHEKSVRMKEKMLEKAKDHFIITQKGIVYENVEVPIVEKPEQKHIFITVSGNIVSGLNFSQKMTTLQQSTLRAENEIEKTNRSMKQPIPKCIPGLLEKLLWEILNNGNVERQLNNLQNSQDYFYQQIVPENRKKAEESVKRLNAVPAKNKIQRFLESELLELICSNQIHSRQCEVNNRKL